MLEIKEIINESDWKIESTYPNYPLTQSFAYGDWQKDVGREIKRICILKDNQSILYCQFVKYPMPLKNHYWYAPYGPIFVNKIDAETITFFEKESKKIVNNSGAVFLRIDPVNSKFFENTDFKSVSLKTNSGSFIQPRSEWVLDISKSSEDILENMHEKHRYSVRLAERKGVEVNFFEKNFSSFLDNFMEIMSLTAKRNKFSLHEKDYYKGIFSYFDKNNSLPIKAFLAVAKHENDILAMHFIVCFSGQAYYLLGASSDVKKNFSAPHFLHYRSMLRAKDLGITTYNFGGISNGSDGKSWQGLTEFKKRFSGKTVSHDFLLDIKGNLFWYYLYSIYRFIRSKI